SGAVISHTAIRRGLSPMNDGTQHQISTVQNTEHAQRLLAAQSRLYTVAKRLHDTRVLTAFGLALLTAVAAFTFPVGHVVIVPVGRTVTFFWSALGSGREKTLRKQGAFVQEEFDTYVFDMPWNAWAAEHPSPMCIAEAADRYRGNRTKDWYPDTGTVARPLDVLICQRSNLGWGASIHRVYANLLIGLLTVFIPLGAAINPGYGKLLIGLLLVLILLGAAIAFIGNVTTAEAVTTFVVPLLGPVRELLEMIRNNCDSSNTKARVELKIHDLWEHALRDNQKITIADCRTVQDQILNIRQVNAHVPDWLDNLRRARNETLMRQSAAHLIEEAVRHGRTR